MPRQTRAGPGFNFAHALPVPSRLIGTILGHGVTYRPPRSPDHQLDLRRLRRRIASRPYVHCGFDTGQQFLSLRETGRNDIRAFSRVAAHHSTLPRPARRAFNTRFVHAICASSCKARRIAFVEIFSLSPEFAAMSLEYSPRGRNGLGCRDPFVDGGGEHADEPRKSSRLASAASLISRCTLRCRQPILLKFSASS